MANPRSAKRTTKPARPSDGQNQSRQAAPRRSADRALLLADAERLEDFHHARRVRPALRRAPDRHFQRRAVLAALSGDLAEQPDSGHRRSRMARAAGRSRCSSPAPSCNISAARPESFIRATSAPASPSMNGCSGRWAGSGRWPARPTTSATTRRSRSPTRIARYTNEVNRLFGVMNTRLAEREFLAGRYSIADMACVGWVRLAERMGQDLGAVSASQALVRNDPRAAGGQARLRHPRRGGVRRSTCTIRKCARSCSGRRRGECPDSDLIDAGEAATSGARLRG